MNRTQFYPYLSPYVKIVDFILEYFIACFEQKQQNLLRYE